MNFKPLLLALLFSTHIFAYKNMCVSLDQAVIESDLESVKVLIKKKNSRSRLMNLLQMSQDVIRHRQEAINNHEMSNSVRQSWQPITLPPQYEARVGGATAYTFGICFALIGMIFWTPLIICSEEDWRHSSNVKNFIENASPRTKKVASGVGLSTLLSAASFYSLYRTRKNGYRFYAEIGREYLEDMYKNALQIRQLIIEQLEESSESFSCN